MKKLAIISLLLLAGCVAQNLPEDWDGRGCHHIFDIEFSYQFEFGAAEGRNVGHVHIYAFDARTGLLTDIIELTREQVLAGRAGIDMPVGKYNFVAWGSCGNSLSECGFLCESTIGRTTIDDFRMTLSTEAVEDAVRPTMDQVRYMFHASAREVEVLGDRDLVVPLNFVRNTNTLAITMSGVDNIMAPTRAGECPFEIFVRGRNGIYTHDNGIHSEADMVHYQCDPHTMTTELVGTDIRVLRLLKDHHVGDNAVRLTIRDRASGDELVNIDVVDAILRMTDDQSRPLYNTQEDIDRQETFPIEINFVPDPMEGGIKITIGDWEIGRYKPTEVVPWVPN